MQISIGRNMSFKNSWSFLTSMDLGKLLEISASKIKDEIAFMCQAMLNQLIKSRARKKCKIYDFYQLNNLLKKIFDDILISFYVNFV